MNSQTPEIRFRGYTEDWEQRKLGETLKVNSGKDYKHLGNGEIPVYGTGGYMLSVDDKLSMQDAIGIGRKGTIDRPQYLQAPFWTVDTLFFMTPFENHNINYLYFMTQRINWKKLDESTGVPSLSKVNINNLKQYFPNYEEQIVIGNFFVQLENTIVLHQHALDILKQRKKAFLQKIFPKNREDSPDIRFSGFNKDWNKSYLRDISDIKKGKQKNKSELSPIKSSTNKYPVINGGMAPSGYSNQYNRENKISISEGGNSAGYVNFIEGKFFSGGHNYTLDIMNEDKYFLKSYLDSRQRELYTLRVGSGLPNIQKPSLDKFTISVPRYEEQEKIGNFFKELDKSIALKEEKIESLKQMKKAFLQKMFV